MALSIKTRLYMNLSILGAALVLVFAMGMLAFSRAAANMDSLYVNKLIPLAEVFRDLRPLSAKSAVSARGIRASGSRVHAGEL